MQPQLRLQPHPIGGLRLARVGVFTSWKLANTKSRLDTDRLDQGLENVDTLNLWERILIMSMSILHFCRQLTNF